MKKKLAMLLAAAMVMGSMPISAFAYSTNGVSKVVTQKTDSKLGLDKAPILLLEDKSDSFTHEMQFDLTLSGAKWWNGNDFEDQIDGYYEIQGTTVVKIADLNKKTGGSSSTDPSDDFVTLYNKLEEAKKNLSEAITKAEGEAAALDITETSDSISFANPAGFDDAIDDLVAAGLIADNTVIPTDVEVKAAAKDLSDNLVAVGDAFAAFSAAEAEFTTAGGDTTLEGIALRKMQAQLDIVNEKLSLDPELTLDETTPSNTKTDISTALSDYDTNVVQAADAAVAAYIADAMYPAYKASKDAFEKYDLENLKAAVVDAQEKVDNASGSSSTPGTDVTLPAQYVRVKKDADRIATVTAVGFEGGGQTIRIPMITELSDSGEATVTVDPMNSEVSGGTYTIAVASDGGTKTTIESKTSFMDPVVIKPLIVTEVAAGSIKGDFQLKLNSGFRFVDNLSDVKVTTSIGDIDLGTPYFKNDGTEKDYNVIVVPFRSLSNKTSKIVIEGLKIKEDGADPGDVATITISNGGTTKETLDVATYTEYGISVTAQDKDLPELHSGDFNEDEDALEVTFKETIENSWLTDRKTTFTFPDGVKVNSVEFKNVKKIDESATALTGTVIIPGGETESKDDQYVVIDNDKNQITIQGLKKQSGKAEFKMILNLSVAADFTGDIDMVVGGPGVEEDQTVTVATAVQPVTVESPVNEILIDYRNTEVGDIIIKENYAGALESKKVLTLQAENMTFESGIEYEVLEGDIKIKEVKKSNGNITIEVDSESSKTPATIKLSGLKLYMNRSLPAGDYKLSVVAGGKDGRDVSPKDEAYIKNYKEDEKALADEKATFDVDEVVIMKDFVKIVTAGREQDDSTFTTQLVVKIGEPTMMAGTKTINLDVPAYINAEGYTMLPVRAVTEALSGSAIVNWDNTTRKVTIIFGSRIISMTVGDTNMTINGTVVPMSSQCVITGERAFIPLRDLGYALGLSDSKINWDPATSTATLN